MMDKTFFSFLCVLVFSFLIPMQLFTDDDLPVVTWEIEDYKRAIVKNNKDMIIYEFEEFLSFETGEKYFLCKNRANARLNNISIFLYAFNKYHEYEGYLLCLGKEGDDNETIISGLIGNQLWDSMVSIGDFNNDGRKEIASLVYAGSAPSFIITGIDYDSKEVVSHLDVEVSVDYPPTYTPVFYINYKDMEGFKILQFIHPSIQAAKPIQFPSSEYRFRNTAWILYIWNENQKKYIEVEEVNPRYEVKVDTKLFQEENDPVVEATESMNFSADTKGLQKTDAVSATYSTFSLNTRKGDITFYWLIGILGLIIIAYIIRLFFIKKTKKKGD